MVYVVSIHPKLAAKSDRDGNGKGVETAGIGVSLATCYPCAIFCRTGYELMR
jgi:hypothetical protein